MTIKFVYLYMEGHEVSIQILVPNLLNKGENKIGISL